MASEAPRPAARPRILGLDWLRDYGRATFRADVVAGFTLAAYLLPSGIGDASLANLPPEAGLYACLFAGLVFWLFCGSRHTTITVTSAISLLLGTSLGGLADGDPARFRALAAGTALLVAGLAGLAWLFRVGGVVRFVSDTVMTGFKSGVALVLASTQLPKLFGLHGSHGNFWERAGGFVAHVGETHLASLALGGTALIVLLLGKKLLPNRPVTLFVVIAGIVAARWLDLGAHGVKTLGNVPRGLPVPGLPALQLEDLNQLLPIAMACFLLGAVESVAIGRMFGRKHGYRLDSDREFLAVGVANLAAGLGAGLPVSGGMSQSLVNESSGARTPVSGLVASAAILTVVLFFSDLLADLPQPVLAAVVLTAVTSLFKLAALKRLWRLHRAEFLIAIAALLGVLGSGILRGVLIGAILSIMVLLRRAARPHVAFLGRIPGLQRFSDLERHPDNESIPGALLLRVEASILYFNADVLRDELFARLDAAPTEIRLVAWDLSTSPHVDVAGAEMLADVQHELSDRGIEFRVVDARSGVRDMLRKEGLEEHLGRISRRDTLAETVAEFLAR